jgi:hypothetical protein
MAKDFLGLAGLRNNSRRSIEPMRTAGHCQARSPAAVFSITGRVCSCIALQVHALAGFRFLDSKLPRGTESVGLWLLALVGASFCSMWWRAALWFSVRQAAAGISADRARS